MSEVMYKWVKATPDNFPDNIGYNYHVKVTSEHAGYEWNDTAIYKGNGEWETIKYGSGKKIVTQYLIQALLS